MGEKQAIFELIPKIMRECGPIAKDRRNPQQGYQFRGIDDVCNALQPVLAKHGVFIVPEVLDEKREERTTKSGGVLIYTTLKMKFSFYAPDGSHIDATTVGEAMDSGDKSANKAQSAAMKYACLQVFCIPTEGDNDSENQSPDPAPRAVEDNRPLPDQAFEIQLDELLEYHEFTKAEAAKVKVAAAKTKKAKSVRDLSPVDRGALMKAIEDGAFNKLKANGQVPVGAK